MDQMAGLGAVDVEMWVSLHHMQKGATMDQLVTAYAEFPTASCPLILLHSVEVDGSRAAHLLRRNGAQAGSSRHGP